MRILILNRIRPPVAGATGRLLNELAAELGARGHEVQSIASGNLPAKIIPYLLSFFSIGFRALMAPRADRVLVMSDPPMLQLWIPFLKIRHGKVFFWCQDIYPDLFPVVGICLPGFAMRLLQKANRMALACGDGVIAIGNCMAERLKVYADKIIINPNWAERDIAPDEVSDQQGLSILYAGNIGMVHPAPAIVTAVQSCRNLPVRFTFMISGKREKFMREKLSAQSNVTFLPPQPWERARDIQSRCHVHLIGLSDAALGLAMPVKTYAAIRQARPYIFIGPQSSEAARLVAQYGCGDVIAPAAAVQMHDLIKSYIEPDGTPSDRWRARLNNTAAAAMPDALQTLVETIAAA